MSIETQSVPSFSVDFITTKSYKGIDQCEPWHTSYVIQRKLETCLLAYLMQIHMIGDTQSNCAEHLFSAAHIIHHRPTLIALQ